MQKPQPKITTDAELAKDEESKITHQWEKDIEEGIAKCRLCNKYINLETIEGKQVDDAVRPPFPMM